MLKGLGRRQQLQPALDVADGVKAARFGKHVAAGEIRRFDIGQVEGRTLTGHRALRLSAVYLQAAHPQETSGGVDLGLLFLFDRARNQRAGHHCAESFHRKHAVDGQPEVAGGILLGHCRGHPRQLPAQLVQTFAGGRAHRYHGSAFEERARHQLRHFHARQIEQFFVDQVGLGQDDEPARNLEQAADLEMLAGLRLDGFVGGHHQHHQVDSAHPGQHVLDEPLMAGYVDEAQPQIGCQLQMGEAEIDGDAAPLLLRQPVCVDAGERFD